MFFAQFSSRKFKSKSELNIQDLNRLEKQARWNLRVIIIVIFMLILILKSVEQRSIPGNSVAVSRRNTK